MEKTNLEDGYKELDFFFFPSQSVKMGHNLNFETVYLFAISKIRTQTLGLCELPYSWEKFENLIGVFCQFLSTMYICDSEIVGWILVEWNVL